MEKTRANEQSALLETCCGPHSPRETAKNGVLWSVGEPRSFPFTPSSKGTKPPSRLYLSPTSISHHHIHNRLTSKHPPLLFFSIIYVSTILAKMCGGAIISDLIPRNRTRRVSPSDIWPDSPFFSTPTPQMKPFPSSSGNHRNICVFRLIHIRNRVW